MAHIFPLSTQADLEHAALASVPLVYRLFRVSLSLAATDRKLRGRAEWEALKSGLKAGDRLWPFEFNRNTSAMRKGLVLMRQGKLHSVLVTELS